MTDGRAAYDEDRLPWLEEVDDEDGARGVSGRRMLAAFLTVLLAAGIVWGTLFWLGRRDSGVEIAGAPELIRAEPGPYKVKPTDPGGLDVAGESETAFKTSAGEDTDSNLDLGAAPEAPVVRPAPKPAPKPAATDEPAKAEPAPPAPVPAGGKGSVIQLGFFDSAAQAERAWTSLSSRFSSVAAMSKVVVPYKAGFRLRAGTASPAAAREACQALIVAGEKCFVAN